MVNYLSVDKRTSFFVQAYVIPFVALVISGILRCKVGCVPVTAQSFVVLRLAASCSRARLSTILLSYLVFSVLTSPDIVYTGGYLIGFIIAAQVLHAEATVVLLPTWLGIRLVVAQGIIWACGVLWLCQLVELRQALVLGVMPFIITDLLKLALVFLSLPRRAQGRSWGAI